MLFPAPGYPVRQTGKGAATNYEVKEKLYIHKKGKSSTTALTHHKRYPKKLRKEEY